MVAVCLASRQQLDQCASIGDGPHLKEIERKNKIYTHEIVCENVVSKIRTFCSRPFVLNQLVYNININS